MLGSGGVLQNPPLNLFSDSYQQLPQNKLTIRLQPDEGIEIQVLNKVPGLDHKHRLQTTKLDLSFSETFNEEHVADAERLLLETMRGIQALFVRRDEVEEARKWVDSIMDAWKADNEAPKPYQAGTGPVASVAMITRDGRSGTSSSNAQCRQPVCRLLPAICAWATSLTVRPDVRAFARSPVAGACHC